MLWHRFQIPRKRLSVIYRATSSTVNNYLKLTKALNKMPLDKRHQLDGKVGYEARKVKIEKFKEKNKNVRIEVIGNGAHGAPRSVHICTDYCRYLFNCGEGTQRLATEYKIKLTRVPHIFITYPSWENVSGLLGLALTQQSTGIPEIFLHGPRQIESVFSATSKFVALRTISLKLEEALLGKEFDDGLINVKYVPLYPSRSESVNKNISETKLSPPSPKHEVISPDEDDDIDYYEHLSKKNHHHHHGQNKKHHNNKRRSQSENFRSNKRRAPMEKLAIGYICRTKSIPGTLMIEKCVDLGVPSGPLLGLLKNGTDITLDDGTVVKSDDVLSPGIPGCTILVIECPTEEFLDSLLQESAFFRHQSGDPDDIAAAVVHFTNSAIVDHPKYKEWLGRFPKSTKHLFINENNKSLGSVSVQRLQHKLNLLDPVIFPLLPDCGLPDYPRLENEPVQSGHTVVTVQPGQQPPTVDFNDTAKDVVFYKCESDSFIHGQTLCALYIRPEKEFDYSKSLVLRKDLYAEEVFAIEGFKQVFEDFQNELKNVDVGRESYPKILFLGTGSSQPNKLRNTSGILVFLDEDSSILLDCGEGTYGQLIQFFGMEKGRDVLRNLNVIYISHLHADHHMGLITLLKQRRLALLEKHGCLDGPEGVQFRPVQLLAPIQLQQWLSLYNSEIEPISSLYSLIPNSKLGDITYMKTHHTECLDMLNLEGVQTTLVDHCPHAFGVALTHKSGCKITYSGDTRPCNNLIKLGQNSDILIHEATMDDSLKHVASTKLHSTTSQAIRVGKQMNAKFILLTHFSQRYSHVPLFNENFTEEVGVAFDNMMVPVNRLPILSKMINPLKVMFSEHYEKMEEKKSLYLLKSKMRRQSESE